jgi:hypothetical protein
MHKKNIASIGFMDTSKVYEFEVKHQPDTTIATIYRCRAYTPGTHARKEEDVLLLEFPCNPTRTHAV